MEKQEIIVYALYNKEEDEYLMDNAYIDKELCFASWCTDKDDALKWRLILDEPDKIEVKKIKITYEVID